MNNKHPSLLSSFRGLPPLVTQQPPCPQLLTPCKLILPQCSPSCSFKHDLINLLLVRSFIFNYNVQTISINSFAFSLNYLKILQHRSYRCIAKTPTNLSAQGKLPNSQAMVQLPIPYRHGSSLGIWSSLVKACLLCIPSASSRMFFPMDQN